MIVYMYDVAALDGLGFAFFIFNINAVFYLIII